MLQSLTQYKKFFFIIGLLTYNVSCMSLAYAQQPHNKISDNPKETLSDVRDNIAKIQSIGATTFTGGITIVTKKGAKVN